MAQVLQPLTDLSHPLFDECLHFSAGRCGAVGCGQQSLHIIKREANRLCRPDELYLSQRLFTVQSVIPVAAIFGRDQSDSLAVTHRRRRRNAR